MAIISKPFAESIPRKPWPLVRNADLLNIVHEVSHHRGRTSIKGGWCKGHGTEGDVRRANVTEENRVANSRADTIAWEARCSNTEWVDSDIVCDAFAVRQRKFAKLAWQVGIQHGEVSLA